MFFFLLLNARPITLFYYLYFLLLYFIYSKTKLHNPSKRVKKNTGIFSRRREKRIRGVPEYLLTYKRITKQKKVLKQQEPRP